MEEFEFAAFATDVVPGLLRYLTRLIGPDEAEDICSQTLLSLWNKGVESPTDEASRSALVALTFLIAKGHLRNAQRGARRRDALTDRFRRLTHGGDHQQDDVLATLILRQETTWLLTGLSPQDRLLVALVVDDFTRAEIAAILGCSTDAVKMRLMRARKKLSDLRGAREGSDRAR